MTYLNTFRQYLIASEILQEGIFSTLSGKQLPDGGLTGWGTVASYQYSVVSFSRLSPAPLDSCSLIRVQDMLRRNDGL